MGKAQRNRGRRIPAGNPVTQLPRNPIFPGFPYKRRFTEAEIQGDILPRAKRLGDAMRDGVAPTGATLFIPPDLFEMLMVHAALAGCDVDESKAYIKARKLPDAHGRFADAVEWVLKEDYTPVMESEDAEREAQRYVTAINDTLDPQVADAIRARMVAEARKAQDFAAPGDPTKHAADFYRDFGPPRQEVIRPEDREDNNP